MVIYRKYFQYMNNFSVLVGTSDTYYLYSGFKNNKTTVIYESKN